MTLTHWLMIAHTVSTLLVPFITGYVISRRSKEALNPNTNQPKPRIKRIGSWLVGFRWSIALFVASSGLGIYNFVRVWRDPGITTRSLILFVAVNVACVSFLITTLFFLFLTSVILSYLRQAIDQLHKMAIEDGEHTINWMTKVTEALKEASESPTKPTSAFDRILDNLRANLKKLIP